MSYVQEYKGFTVAVDVEEDTQKVKIYVDKRLYATCSWHKREETMKLVKQKLDHAAELNLKKGTHNETL